MHKASYILLTFLRHGAILETSNVALTEKQVEFCSVAEKKFEHYKT